ncbi:MAG: hypothetical protein JXA54_13390, partial [Candidatus Heimdallarchaeota archaeon]|nr:hypothetical protein [Candidatus Heimdallarchaeota archaeon]
ICNNILLEIFNIYNNIKLKGVILLVDEVKEEATGKRPSILSKWYRRTLGTDYAIADIDFVITRISNKDKNTRYLIIEEKNVSSFDRLSMGLGEARRLLIINSGRLISKLKNYFCLE